jgi:hypothetical protein
MSETEQPFAIPNTYRRSLLKRHLEIRLQMQPLPSIPEFGA